MNRTFKPKAEHTQPDETLFSTLCAEFYADYSAADFVGMVTREAEADGELSETENEVRRARAENLLTFLIRLERRSLQR